MNLLLCAFAFLVALSPPVDVKATKIIDNDSLSITLSWSPSPSAAVISGYEVYRSRYRFLDSLIQDSTFIDTTVLPDHNYYYDIVKKEAVRIKYKIDKENNRLYWQLPEQALGFTEIEVLCNNESIGLLPLSQTEFQDSVINREKARYQVRALKKVSVPYEVISDTTIGTDRCIKIKWKRPKDLYLGEHYEIWRMEQFGEYELIGSVSPKTLSYKDTTMKDGVKYYYKVAATKKQERSFSLPSDLVSTIGIPKCLVVRDTPDDEGESFEISWELSPNDAEIKNYLLLRFVYDSLASFKDCDTYTDTTAEPEVDYRYTVVKSYEIAMPCTIVADSMGKTGRVIRIEWKIDPKVIGQKYDLTLIFRATKGKAGEFKYVDYTSPEENKFMDGTAEKEEDYIYEARAIKEISIPYRITRDTTNNGKRFITLVWRSSKEPNEFQGYVVQRGERISGTYGIYARLGKGVNKFKDRVGLFNGVAYAYKLVGVTKDGRDVFSETTPYVTCAPQWFHKRRTNCLIALVVFVSLVLYFIRAAKRGHEFYVRPIPGVQAIDEAIGRATEMGRPILYVPGTSSIGDVATIASLNILAEVAKKTAQYETPLIVPNRDPIVYTVAREVVKESYNKAGRPDAYNPDSVYFVTDAQFAFAAAVDGIMTREKPSTNFLIGMFWAESLIMAETGAATGAIQIAGTDAVTQLPFFITACDYTLIGEELYAASAYISKNPTLLSALKSQDYGKLVIVAILILGTVIALANIGVPVFNLFNIY